MRKILKAASARPASAGYRRLHENQNPKGFAIYVKSSDLSDGGQIGEHKSGWGYSDSGPFAEADRNLFMKKGILLPRCQEPFPDTVRKKSF